MRTGIVSRLKRADSHLRELHTQRRAARPALFACTRLLLPCLLIVGALPLQSASAGIINVTQAFRFIRTDTYAETGGVIDHGSFTVAGASTPAGGSGAQGPFTSTLENVANAASGFGSASSLARVEIDSVYNLTASTLDFNVDALLRLSTVTSGDGLIQNPLPDINCCRSFAFLNHFIVFEITDAYSFSVIGTPASTTTLRDQGTGTLLNSGAGAGILGPGTYRFTVLDSIEVSGGNSIDRTNQFDVAFNLQAIAVSGPGTIGLFCLGLLGAAIRRYRRA